MFTYTIKDGDGDLSHTTLTISIGNSPPTITNLTPAAGGGDVTVNEDDLLASRGVGKSAGSDTSKESLTQAGTFTVSSPDGIKSLTIDGHTVISNGVFTATSFTTSTLSNTLSVTGYNAATGVVSYSYTLLDNETHAAGAGTNSLFENLAVVLTDQDNQTANDTLVATIIDDVPTAVADIDSVVAGTPGPATGNVLTGGTDALDSNTTDGVADVQGADGAVVVGGAAGTTNADLDNPATLAAVIQGAFGKLTLAADGSYSYTRDPGTAGGASDVFTYTVKDGDGDLSHTTLTISVGNSTPTDTNLAPAAGGGDVTVNEDDLLASRGVGESAGSDTSKESLTQTGTFTVSSPDGIKSLTIDGHTVISNDVFTAKVRLSTVRYCSIVASTAILLCIRNELPERMICNLRPLLAGLDRSGFGDSFHVYVLSDTSDPQIAAVEQERFAELANAWNGRIAMTYRRRAVNTGFKAGNIWDFCEQWGAKHEFAVSLDADSFMTADATLLLVRIMQADPKLGILQGLVVGLPSTSAFARVFQFGMRLGMRSYTIGSAWWQEDCGPYWGHNAVFRLAPFIAHCELPVLSPGGSEARHILSHDQIEAALMRAAGYSVRVLPEEGLGWEENPPTLLEFIRRDLRWCQGNMQYWRFLASPGIKPVSRYQLGLAILMFIGSPAWIGMLVLATLALALVETPTDFMRIDAGIALFVCVLVMWFSPKIASAIDILLRPELRREFGGTGRFVANFAIEAIYSILLCPILWFGHTIFLSGLLLGRNIGWIGQTRDDHVVPFTQAMQSLWPHTLLGLATLGILAATQPAALPYALFLAGGPALSIPFAMITAWPSLGRLFARIGIGRLPEETIVPAGLDALALPALEIAAPARQSNSS